LKVDFSKQKRPIAWSQLCHLDRSAAQWRDLRFPLPVLTNSKAAA
jgi:hypothetical protein